MRLGNYWMRLHKKLKELQADRKAAEPEAQTPPPEPVKPVSKNEPSVVEINSFQRNNAGPAPATPRTGTEPNRAATGTEPVQKPENGADKPHTGK